jgi:hypothetical protein
VNGSPLSPGQIDQLLHELSAERVTGAVRFNGVASGTLFLDAGLIYFAAIDGRPLTAVELANAGIEHRTWQEAGGRPGARGHFADELMALGCPRHAIESFVHERVVELVSTIRTEGATSTDRTGARHGFGATVGLDPLRYVRSTVVPQPDTLISLDRTSAATVTIDRIAWNAIAELVAPFRYAELAAAVEHPAQVVAALEQAGLITTVRSDSDGRGLDVDHAPAAEVGSMESEPEAPTDSDIPRQLFSGEDDDFEEYVPDRVGRQTYAAIASMRASARAAEPSHSEKTHALKRLIDAVRGL